jgi:hypothetical protein
MQMPKKKLIPFLAVKLGQVIQMDSSEFQLFKEFQAFKKMKEMADKTAAAPAPAPKTFAAVAAAAPVFTPSPAPSSGGSVASDDDSFASLYRRVPLKVNYESQMQYTIQKFPFRGDGWSEHANLFMLFGELYKEFPERFRLTGELHADEDGRTYFSYRYDKPGSKSSATFHAYGNLTGNKFMVDSVDIGLGAQIYKDAAKFAHRT